MTNYPLLKRAVILFPRTDYTDDSAVRHARREYIKAIDFLRRSKKSIWILDTHIQRKAA